MFLYVFLDVLLLFVVFLVMCKLLKMLCVWCVDVLLSVMKMCVFDVNVDV